MRRIYKYDDVWHFEYTSKNNEYCRYNTCEYCGIMLHTIYVEIINTLKDKCLIDNNYNMQCCFCFLVNNGDSEFFERMKAGALSLSNENIGWSYDRISEMYKNYPEMYNKLKELLGNHSTIFEDKFLNFLVDKDLYDNSI